MMKKRVLILVVSIVFVFASVQPVFGADLMDNGYPKVVSANKMVKGSLSSSDDNDLYSFFGNGGTYKIELYSETGDWMYVDTCRYYFNSVNPGWQKPEYHADGGEYNICDEFELTSDGWYKCTVKIGKVKAGKKVGIGISGESKGAYKFKVIGKKFADPKMPVVKSVKGKKHAMKVKWKKAKNAKGYLIQISHNKGWGKNYKEVRVKGSKVSKTIKNLKKGRYYVKICSYKKVKGVTAYSKWTKAKKVIVK